METVDIQVLDTGTVDAETLDMRTVHRILLQPSSRCHTRSHIVQMDYFELYLYDRGMS